MQPLPKLPERTELDRQIDLAWHQMKFALTSSSRVIWTERYEQLRAKRKKP